MQTVLGRLGVAGIRRSDDSTPARREEGLGELEAEDDGEALRKAGLHGEDGCRYFLRLGYLVPHRLLYVTVR